MRAHLHRTPQPDLMALTLAREDKPDYPINIRFMPDAITPEEIEQIARAVNSHEALCAALEDAYAHVTLLGCGEKPPLSDAEMCNLLGDALKLARGES